MDTLELQSMRGNFLDVTIEEAGSEMSDLDRLALSECGTPSEPVHYADHFFNMDVSYAAKGCPLDEDEENGNVLRGSTDSLPHLVDDDLLEEEEEEDTIRVDPGPTILTSAVSGDLATYNSPIAEQPIYATCGCFMKRRSLVHLLGLCRFQHFRSTCPHKHTGRKRKKYELHYRYLRHRDDVVQDINQILLQAAQAQAAQAGADGTWKSTKSGNTFVPPNKSGSLGSAGTSNSESSTHQPFTPANIVINTGRRTLAPSSSTSSRVPLGTLKRRPFDASSTSVVGSMSTLSRIKNSVFSRKKRSQKMLASSSKLGR